MLKKDDFKPRIKKLFYRLRPYQKNIMLTTCLGHQEREEFILKELETPMSFELEMSEIMKMEIDTTIRFKLSTNIDELYKFVDFVQMNKYQYKNFFL